MTRLTRFHSQEMSSQDVSQGINNKNDKNEVIQEIQKDLDTLLDFIQDFSLERRNPGVSFTSLRSRSYEGSMSTTSSSIVRTKRGTEGTSTNTLGSEVTEGERRKDQEEEDNNTSCHRESRTRDSFTGNTSRRTSWLPCRASLGSLFHLLPPSRPSSSSCHPDPNQEEKSHEDDEGVSLNLSVSTTKNCHSKGLSLSPSSSHAPETSLIASVSSLSSTASAVECNARLLAAELKQHLAQGDKLIKGRNNNNKESTKIKKHTPSEETLTDSYSTRGDQCLKVCYIEFVVSVFYQPKDTVYSGNISLSSYSMHDKEATMPGRERRAIHATSIKSSWDDIFSGFLKDEEAATNNNVMKQEKDMSVIETLTFPFFTDSLPDKVKESVIEKGNRIRMKLERDYNYQVYDWKTNSLTPVTQQSEESTCETGSQAGNSSVPEAKIVVYEKVMMLKKIVKSRDQLSSQQQREMLAKIAFHEDDDNS